MTLKTLVRELSYTLCAGTLERDITALVYDSRKVVPGSIFVCLTGFQTDGHDYIPMALEKGAGTLVVEHEVEAPEGVTVLRVEDGRVALALLSAAWFGYPAREMTVIGLTGTKGKTTTAHMVKAILEAAGHKVGMIGTIGAFVGEERLPTKNTTPESYELHSLFRRMADAGCGYVVMEASSQGFKLSRTAGILFDYGAFLNISHDHIGAGEHADFEEYLACKQEIFRQSGMGLVNRDDPLWQRMTEKAECPVATFSLEGDADYRFTHVTGMRKSGFLGSEFDAEGAFSAHLHLNLPGRFNVYNAAAAVAITAMCGVSAEDMDRALRTVSVRGRTQIMPTDRDYTLLIDYAHNAVSMENLLSLLKEYEHGRLICVFGGGGGRDKARRYDMGEISAKYADLTVLTMDNPRDEDMESINEDIKVGLARHNGKYLVIPDRRDAIRWAMDHAREGDIVALIGKGHEEYQEIKGVKYHFSEAEVIRSYLEEKQKSAR